jgi:hypothetical protein
VLLCMGAGSIAGVPAQIVEWAAAQQVVA